MASKKIKSEVKKIIKSNPDLVKENHLLASAFFHRILNEAEEALKPEDVTDDKTKKAVVDSLEPTTDPKDLDIKDVPNINVNAEYIGIAKQWVTQLDEFTEFLNNSEDSNSLHRILADVDRAGSLFRGITRKTSDSIIRIAGEIERLKEVLNGFIIMAPKKLRDIDNSRI